MVAPQVVCPSWIRWWLFLSGIVVIWDAGYLLLRPHSMPGGSLHSVWKPYEMYAKVDLIYGDARWQSGDRFGEAQALCNLAEVAFQFVALTLMSRRDRGAAAGGVVLALITQAFTLWKTVLYWLYDFAGGWAHTGHNDPFHLYVVFVLPNSLWIIVPSVVVVVLGRRIGVALAGGAGAGAGKLPHKAL